MNEPFSESRCSKAVFDHSPQLRTPRPEALKTGSRHEDHIHNTFSNLGSFPTIEL